MRDQHRHWSLADDVAHLVEHIVVDALVNVLFVAVRTCMQTRAEEAHLVVFVGFFGEVCWFFLFQLYTLIHTLGFVLSLFFIQFAFIQLTHTRTRTHTHTHAHLQFVAKNLVEKLKLSNERNETTKQRGIL